MNNEGMNLADIFEPFYDRKEEYDALMERLSKEQDPGDGSHQALIFLTGLNEADQKIVDSYIRSEERRLQAMAQAQNVLPVGSSIPYAPVAPAVIQLSMMKSGLKLEERKLNHYILLQKVLSQCCIRSYRGQLYYLNECGVYVKLSDGELKSLLFAVLETEVALTGGPQVLRYVQELLVSFHRIRAERTTDDINHIYFRNGCFDAISGTFRTISQEDFFTSYINCDYPVGYTPSCPNFDAYLQTVSGGDVAIIECVWEMLGYLLVPDMSAKVFFLLQGVGDSGKSVLGNLISSLFNPEAVAHLDIFRFKSRFDISGLEGCRANVSMDLPSNKLSTEAVATIKMLTGEDGITIEAKYKDARPAAIDCKLVFGSNHPLLIPSQDPAFSNRMVIIPFQHSIPKERQDPNLRQKLRNERSAIVVRAIQAYSRLKERNYQFPQCGNASLNGICGFVPLAEALAQFVGTCCEFTEGAFTPTSVLLAGYNAFADANGFPGFSDPNQFSRQFNHFCGGRVQNKKQRENGIPCNGYLGIRLENR